jgi:uncharacterized metal-binding protein
MECEKGPWPAACPTGSSWDERGELVKRTLADPFLLEMARTAGVQEAAGYEPCPSGTTARPARTRIEETAEFAERLGVRKLGLAFCVGLAREAAACAVFFESRGFEVASVCCKVGALSKTEIGLTPEQRIIPGRDESLCNPVLQAAVLNGCGTGLNVLVGLCVGHDSVFFRESKAPCTVLACKDRVTGHNPLAAVYTLESYYKCLIQGF